ncbi:ABC transporter permease [Neobacillus muris]|uniref:ABC transporter permease n=1 Tax=Neobacillus muris TaxID=2941334 RepID=UPI002040D76D|nr:ABC transporter permease [Neobacillus muris]
MKKIKQFNAAENAFLVEDGLSPEQDVKETASLKSILLKLLNEYTIVWIVILTGLILFISNEHFGTVGNLTSVLRQSAFVGIGAVGMTFVIMGGGIDLSVPGIVSLTAVIGAFLMPVAGVVVGLLAALLCGIFLGLINGMVIMRLKIPPFVATLGTGYVYLSIVFMITNEQVVMVNSPIILNVGMGSLLGIPIPFIILIACTLLCSFLSKCSRYGRLVRSIGSSLNATRAAGISVNRVTIFSYMVLGLLTALTGVILSGYLSSANGNMGTGYDLNTIAAAVVGGTSLQGGKGSFVGTLAGALFFSMISNALDLFGVGSYWQYVATGSVIIFAITLDGLKAKYKSHA